MITVSAKHSNCITFTVSSWTRLLQSVIITFGLSLILPSSALAQLVTQPNRFWHYVRTHKSVLVLDSLVVLAQSADAASSVHCQRIPGCVESNGIVGKHPGPAALWAWSLGTAGTLVASNHLYWWQTGKRDARDLRPLMFLWNGPLVIYQVFNVKSNVDAAEYLQNRQLTLPRVRLPHYRE